jgi:hypothetical protein
MARCPTARRARRGHRDSPKTHRRIDETIAPVDRSISLTGSPRLHRHNAVDLVRLRKSMSPESLACVADLIAELQA